MVTAQIEHERGGAIEHPGFEDLAVAAHFFQPVVTGPGFAPQLQQGAVAELEAARQTPGGAGFHHLRECGLECLGHLAGQHPIGLIGLGCQQRFERRSCGKVQRGEALHRQTDTVVEDDAHEFGQGCRPISGATNGGCQGRNQVVKGITEFLPTLVDIAERLDFQHGADATIPRGSVPGFE